MQYLLYAAIQAGHSGALKLNSGGALKRDADAIIDQSGAYVDNKRVSQTVRRKILSNYITMSHYSQLPFTLTPCQLVSTQHYRCL